MASADLFGPSDDHGDSQVGMRLRRFRI